MIGMADICDFLYTQGGLRLKSGVGKVIISIEGNPVELKVIRNGKGRSRIERGEINLRDLSEYIPEGESVEVSVDLDGVSVPLKIDPRNAMGAGGRAQVSDINRETDGLSDEQRVALARYQLQSLPYSQKNSNEASTRLMWALKQPDLGYMSPEKLRNMAAFLDTDTLDFIYRWQI